MDARYNPSVADHSSGSYYHQSVQNDGHGEEGEEELGAGDHSRDLLQKTPCNEINDPLPHSRTKRVHAGYLL